MHHTYAGVHRDPQKWRKQTPISLERCILQAGNGFLRILEKSLLKINSQNISHRKTSDLLPQLDLQPLLCSVVVMVPLITIILRLTLNCVNMCVKEGMVCAHMCSVQEQYTLLTPEPSFQPLNRHSYAHNKWFFLIFKGFLYYYQCIHVHMYVMISMWRPEDDYVEWIFSIYIDITSRD